MTLEQWSKSYMNDRGMFPRDAEAVFDLMRADPANDFMKGRWSDQVEGYPESILVITAMTIDALGWIDANKPKAWFRDAFDRCGIA